MPSLLPQPRWLYFSRKPRRAEWKGRVRVCPTGRLRWISFGIIHSAKRLESLLLLIHQITQKFKFNRSWLTRFNLRIFFNEVQMETRSPEKFLTLFSLKTVPRLSFLFFLFPALTWHITQAPADCITAEELGIKHGWHVCRHVFPGEGARQRPCNWPWLRSTTRSNQVTMRSIFLWWHNNHVPPALSQLFPWVTEQYMPSMNLMTSRAHTEFKRVGRSTAVH